MPSEQIQPLTKPKETFRLHDYANNIRNVSTALRLDGFDAAKKLLEKEPLPTVGEYIQSTREKPGNNLEADIQYALAKQKTTIEKLDEYIAILNSAENEETFITNLTLANKIFQN